MDSQLEFEYLEIIEKHKQAILTKSCTPEAKRRRIQCWEEIKEELYIKSGKKFEESVLKTKWNNAQQRLKDKMKKYPKVTGGGPPSSLSKNYLLVHKILGENNPKLSMIPNPKENADDCVPPNHFENKGNFIFNYLYIFKN